MRNNRAYNPDIHSRNVFEYVESEIDANIGASLKCSVVGITNVASKAQDIFGILRAEGLKKVRILKVNKFTYYLNTEDNESWQEGEFTVLRRHFVKVRKFQEEDLIIPRVVEVECMGLPVSAWVEENLKAYTKFIGEWYLGPFRMSMNFQFTILGLFASPTNGNTTCSDDVFSKSNYVHSTSRGETNTEDGNVSELPVNNAEDNGVNEGNMEEHERSESVNVGMESSKQLSLVEESLAPLVINDSCQINVSSSMVDTIVPESVILKDTEDNGNLCDRAILEESESNELEQWQYRGSCTVDSSNCLDTEVMEDDVQPSEVIEDTLMEGNFMSQSSICKNLVKINLGAKKGRPRKKGKNRVQESKVSRRNEENKNRPSENIVNVSRAEEEAAKILDIALDMGLSIIGGREEGIKALAKEIESLSLLSWNVRGVSNCVSKRMVKDVSLECKANLVCLQETKCASWNILSIRGLCGFQDVEWIEVAARGLSGGLLCVWDKSIDKLVHGFKDDNWIFCKFQSLVENDVFSVINVYSAHDIDSKRRLWMVLANFISNLRDESICIIGDFNSIHEDSERANCSYRRSDMDGFNSFIDNSNLLDLALSNSELRGLAREEKIGSVPFKVFNSWLRDEELCKVIELQICNDVQGGGLDVLSILRRARTKIKEWSKTECNKIDVRIKEVERSLDAADTSDTQQVNSDVIRELLGELYEQKVDMLRQKARVSWQINGDRNTKFYHQCIQKRNRRNLIRKIFWRHSWVSLLHLN
ncbi:hypothetical protein POM88_008632 [Heracleum sosnowskyi]|uniref:Endonuclease/exonuclease/phosphatase domain-containing protein n=1 Tax=Heracleum sosnowskyi TaxID=360622 RepID=A0AAD8J722_9APIA|nr:hypothetical protein POM88_008632 [Heracleum sosnowskyi]